ncbi:uncharacterized protein SPPG_05413 [Spizellomyces punctatus DAOM BR117]|uniref:SH3 domain-containing protein n=1 Tax=Spizellomyces punctatus (strain DAOM BR117) TaxID=645134 RepID=A0A0L0HDR5_SPIPD|nr:uncharacterized protein SPPG_05413 [Spizellomyces punctatus DAOM BR117]KNC99156.1 hypothetical protein SPPG_05413 [Spizellomyces punctatus DAOM BR117]|eukprot:XP_016607196.1 hypothetical protein SPPG_05413 [Spizellomyces punctatus DAOM BR117]
MPSAKSCLATAASVLFFVAAASAQSPAIGQTCNPKVDFNGCNGQDFLVCQDVGRWILQNRCSTVCTNDDAFKSLCSNNQQVGAGAPSGSTTPSNGPTQSPSGTSAPSTSGGNDGKSNAGAIAGGIIGGLAGVALLLGGVFFYRRRSGKPTAATATAATLSASGKRQEEGLIMTQGGSSSSTLGPGTLNVTSVLEKKYVVRHDYEPAAEDEIKLTVGDRIRLDLLFNDGWAKGTNEDTGKQGLLPVACLQEA